MYDYWTPTAMLFHRKKEELTEDERASLTFYIAFIDDMDGLAPSSAPRRWCAAARAAEGFAREHGRLPASTDPGPLSLWVESQHATDLNSFQRARLGAIRGWGDLRGWVNDSEGPRPGCATGDLGASEVQDGPSA